MTFEYLETEGSKLAFPLKKNLQLQQEVKHCDSFLLRPVHSPCWLLEVATVSFLATKNTVLVGWLPAHLELITSLVARISVVAWPLFVMKPPQQPKMLCRKKICHRVPAKICTLCLTWKGFALCFKGVPHSIKQKGGPPRFNIRPLPKHTVLLVRLGLSCILLAKSR